MTTARVKIAPVERWCSYAKDLLARSMTEDCESSSGLEIGIVTESMRPSMHCDGRAWIVSALSSSIVPIDAETGKEVDPNERQGLVCEHMLEID